ncbi:MAG: hypothetical protein LIP09_11955 [Bacteroidales bacterium]|nr:hypothetical protein [Bacteroidales bacterium]
MKKAIDIDPTTPPNRGYPANRGKHDRREREARARQYGDKGKGIPLGFSPMQQSCIVPTEQWDGETGIDSLLERYYEENKIQNKRFLKQQKPTEL